MNGQNGSAGRGKAASNSKRGPAIPKSAEEYRRYVGGLVSKYFAEKQNAAAAKALSYPIPGWSEESAPSGSSLEVIVRLATFLAIFKQPERALALLESVEAFIAQNSAALELLGNLRVRTGRPERGLENLLRAQEIGPVRPSLTMALAEAGTAMDDRAFTAQHAIRYIDEAPAYLSPAKESQTALFAVPRWSAFVQSFKSSEELHFAGNFPSQLHYRHGDKYRFLSVFVDSKNALKALDAAPKPDLVYNAFVNPEDLLRQEAIDRLSTLIELWGVPVINHPSKVLSGTRDAATKRYAGIPGLVVPKVRRYERKGDHGELVRTIEAEIGYPMIIRGLTEQEGKNAFKVSNRDGLSEAISTVVARPYFYAIHFHESRHQRDLYRKIRAAVVGNLIQIVRVDYDTQWNVHGRKSSERVQFYLDNPDLIEEERQICMRPEEFFGPHVMETLRAMRERVPLDIFGIDFDVTKDGSVLFFEANAAMNLLTTAPRKVDHPRDAEAAFFAGFQAYIAQLRVAGADRPALAVRGTR